MKKEILLSFLLLILIIGCNKQDCAPKAAIANSLMGKWTYKEYFYSTGEPGSWHPVTPANLTIEFLPDSSFLPNDLFLKGATSFEIVDSAKIKFQPANTQSGYILMGYEIKTAEGELYLYPVDPMCIEGCSNKFVK
jgi:hypothetical protein